jgi:hypothetical protein
MTRSSTASAARPPMWPVGSRCATTGGLQSRSVHFLGSIGWPGIADDAAFLGEPETNGALSAGSAPSRSSACGPSCTTPSTGSARPWPASSIATTPRGRSAGTATWTPRRHIRQLERQKRHDLGATSVQATGAPFTASDDQAAGVLVVAPAALLHPVVPQPDGTVLYELVTGHPGSWYSWPTSRTAWTHGRGAADPQAVAWVRCRSRRACMDGRLPAAVSAVDSGRGCGRRFAPVEWLDRVSWRSAYPSSLQRSHPR